MVRAGCTRQADGRGEQSMSALKFSPTLCRFSQAALMAFALASTAHGVTISTPSTLSRGVVGQFYSATLTATGGTAPFHWFAPTGGPAGLSLNSLAGTISGTPTAAGTFTFTIQ